jgi:hypothetical protein
MTTDHASARHNPPVLSLAHSRGCATLACVWGTSMNRATEILLSRVPEHLRPEMERDLRSTGRTTLLADQAVQTLMTTGAVTCRDHANSPRLFQVVRERLLREHRHLSVAWDTETLTIQLVAPAAAEHETRNRLIEAARTLGPTATGEEIADRAGVPRTSINYYFRNGINELRSKV